MNTCRCEVLSKCSNVHVSYCCVSYFLIWMLSSNNGERVMSKSIFVHLLNALSRKRIAQLCQKLVTLVFE